MSTTIVVQGPDDPVLRFAADELACYASRMTGATVGRGEPGAGPGIFLRIDPAIGPGDSFLLRSAPDGLVVSAAAPRGILYGVYAYLESLGARFPFPGVEHEVIPRRDLATVGYDRLETPSFDRRGMTFSGERDHALGWIDFAGKHRVNWVFHHTQIDQRWWVTNREVVWPELRKRGIRLELGGHDLPHLLPRRLFAEHPEWFRLSEGRRTPEGNFCPSCRPATDYLQERVREIVREMPEADVYNVWADDTAEDGSAWCSCAACRDYSPSEQNLLAMNAMARAVRDVRPAAKLVHLAYHETIAPPRKVAPDPGVVLMFAPRERCYAHALDDPACAKNRRHAAWLDGLLRVFDPGQAEVFEYYPDQVVFNHLMPALPRTIAGDARYYRRLGIGLVEPLLTPFTHGWPAPPAAAILQSRALWDADADLDAVLADHARTSYGSETMVEFFRLRERALGRAIAACDFAHPVAAFWTPPLDRPDVTARYLDGLGRSLDDLRLARAALARAGREAEPSRLPRLADEERAFDLANRRVNGLVHFARGALAYARFRASHEPADAREAIGHFEHAYADLNAILTRDGRPTRTFDLADRLIRELQEEATYRNS